MNYWFIRLGAKSQPESRKLYEDFAKSSDLVKIGYGIQKDITKEDRNGIREHLYENGERGMGLSQRTGLIDTFINHMKVGDIVVCPFSSASPEKVRIGIIYSNCGTVESFFKFPFALFKKKQLQEIIGRNKYSDGQEPVEIKPARKVKWVTEEMTKDELSSGLQSELKKFMPKTVTKLDFKEEEVADFLNFIDFTDSSDEVIENTESSFTKVILNNNRFFQGFKKEKMLAAIYSFFKKIEDFLGNWKYIIGALGVIAAVIALAL